ncbi:MAG: radical SAM protein [Candidatus Alcyoniella australis]|nr:radical SAM protein [Candidatus Alcyoniella australis]
MRLAFVFNPFSYKLHEENLRVVQRFFGLFPPLSICWAAGIAEAAGHEVQIIDARTLGLSKEQTLERLKQFKPDAVGLMMTTYMFLETMEWVRFIKQGLRDVPVIIGGYNLRVYPKESLVHPEVDFGCVNSALNTLPALLGELEHGGNFHDVPGLVFRDNGRIVQTPEVDPAPSFVDYPLPHRASLPNELYEEFPTERKNFTVMVTSKGCPHACVFCEAGRTPHDARTPEQVVDEMEQVYHRFGVREIDIFDYEFPLNQKRTRRICKLIKERNLDILWACRSRVDSVDEALLRDMADAGCGRIYYGIEHGMQQKLDEINKGISLKMIRDTIKLTRDCGIRPLGFFLIGVPGETRQSVASTIKFAKSLHLDYVQFSKLTAKPWTGMWRELVQSTGYDYWREYVMGRAVEAALPRPWTDLTNEDIDRLTKWAYINFHARPLFLMRHTLKVRTLGEFRRKFMGFLEMTFRQESRSEDWLERNQPFEVYKAHPKARQD